MDLKTLIISCLAALLLSCHAPESGSAEKAKSAKHKAARDEEALAEGVKAPALPKNVITRKEVQAVDPSGREPMEDAITCLARTIYWEARSSGRADMEAIANVVVNRLGHEGFPGTICGVVKEKDARGACQFSWWCAGQPDAAQEPKSYAIAKEIARKALNGEIEDVTRGALYFHGRHMTPSWARHYVRTASIDGHLFYKPRGNKAK